MKKLAGWGLGAGAAAAIVGGAAWSTRRRWMPNFVTQDEVNETTLLLLASPVFSGSRFAEQVIGPTEISLYDLDAHEVYFTAPAAAWSDRGARPALAKFLADPESIQILSSDSDRIRFKTGDKNFQVNPDLLLIFPYSGVEYKVSLRELTRYLNNTCIWGGKLDIVIGRDSYSGKPICLSNHGAFVAKAGEPSLARFVGQLTKAVDPAQTDSRERKIQTLVDFVTSQVRYDYAEASWQGETLKRPTEVLMSGGSDCSGKTILLASLLEQINEDYLMVYMDQHIAVAVKQGGFQLQRGIHFSFEKTKWILVEATAEEFTVGNSAVDYPNGVPKIRYLQRPRDKNVIIDADTGRKAQFLGDY